MGVPQKSSISRRDFRLQIIQQAWGIPILGNAHVYIYICNIYIYMLYIYRYTYMYVYIYTYVLYIYTYVLYIYSQPLLAITMPLFTTMNHYESAILGPGLRSPRWASRSLAGCGVNTS